jgi:hypothetical protein
VRLGGQFSAWPCRRHLCPLEFRRSYDCRTSRRHSKDPIEWLNRWGWPAPRLVLPFNYIAVEAPPLCLTSRDNQILNSILATPLHTLYRFRITTQFLLTSLIVSFCSTSQTLFKEGRLNTLRTRITQNCTPVLSDLLKPASSRLRDFGASQCPRQLCQEQTRSATRLHHSRSQPLQVVYLWC